MRNILFAFLMMANMSLYSAEVPAITYLEVLKDTVKELKSDAIAKRKQVGRTDNGKWFFCGASTAYETMEGLIEHAMEVALQIESRP